MSPALRELYERELARFVEKRRAEYRAALERKAQKSERAAYRSLPPATRKALKEALADYQSWEVLLRT